MSSNANYPPPQVPPGWIALWDEQSQRYYYVEQATGKTQWEVPTSSNMPSPMGFPTPTNTPQSTSNYSPSPASVNFPQQSTPASYPQQSTPVSGSGGVGVGESNSYSANTTNNSNNNTSYPSYSNNTPGSTMPGGNGDEANDRGLGSALLSGFMKPNHSSGGHHSSGSGFPTSVLGGALGGAVLTMAASKLSSGKHSNHSGYGGHSSHGSSHGASGLIGSFLGGHGSSSNHQNGYYPPPPPNYGYGYDAHHGQHGHHGHHGHHHH